MEPEQRINDQKSSFSYENDAIMYVSLIRLKCQEVIFGEKANTSSVQLKSDIFKIDDEQSCIANIDNCTKGYIGMLAVQLFKFTIRRLEATDLKEAFCSEYLNFLDVLVEEDFLDIYFIFTFCISQVGLPRLEMKLLQSIEAYYGSMDSHDLHQSICKNSILIQKIDVANLRIREVFKEALTELISGCQKQMPIVRYIKELPLRDELFGKIKSYFDDRFNKLEKMIQSIKNILPSSKKPV